MFIAKLARKPKLIKLLIRKVYGVPDARMRLHTYENLFSRTAKGTFAGASGTGA